MRHRPVLIAGALAAFSPALSAQLPDYHRADSVALAVPARVGESVDSIALYLGRDLTSNEERARAIFRWVTENIDYDAGAFYGSRLGIPLQTPEAVLRRRRAVCDGYAALVWALGHELGLEVTIIEGWAKGAAANGSIRRGTHAWNAVRIGDEWRLIDATWGAGDLIDRHFVRRVRDFYFFADPERLAFSHLPRDARWQLVTDPLSGSEFDHQAAPSRDFWDLGWEAGAVRQAGRELVGAFPVEGHPVRVREAPVAGRLAMGQPVRLALEAPGATEVIAVSGDRWVPLSGTDGVFSGEAEMAAEKLVVMIRYPERPEGAVVLEWKARR